MSILDRLRELKRSQGELELALAGRAFMLYQTCGGAVGVDARESESISDFLGNLSGHVRDCIIESSELELICFEDILQYLCCKEEDESFRKLIGLISQLYNRSTNAPSTAKLVVEEKRKNWRREGDMGGRHSNVRCLVCMKWDMIDRDVHSGPMGER